MCVSLFFIWVLDWPRFFNQL
uniref:Uncharacterized protein n=1 Tax=Rhizophora mucronata TaxID=61149 RepID=A0A2P2PPR3_RHIMU